MKLRLTRRALADLDHIHDYIRERNPIAAQKIGSELRFRINLLCKYPEAGRLRRPGVRCFPVPRRPYLIFYWPDTDAGELIVFTIRHAARQDED